MDIRYTAILSLFNTLETLQCRRFWPALDRFFITFFLSAHFLYRESLRLFRLGFLKKSFLCICCGLDGFLDQRLYFFTLTA